MLSSGDGRRAAILLRPFQGLHSLFQVCCESVVRADNFSETALEVARLLSGLIRGGGRGWRQLFSSRHHDFGVRKSLADHLYTEALVGDDDGLYARVGFAKLFIRRAQSLQARLGFPRSCVRILKLVFEPLSSYPMKLCILSPGQHIWYSFEASRDDLFSHPQKIFMWRRAPSPAVDCRRSGSAAERNEKYSDSHADQ